MPNKTKVLPFVLLAVVLVLSIVFFIQSQDPVANEVLVQEENVENTEGASLVADTEYMIDVDNSFVQWKGEKKLVNSNHVGNISVKSGLFEVAAGQLVAGEVVMDMTSMTLAEGDNGGEKLLGHLEAEDFFDVENHPEASLVFDRVEERDGNVYGVGELTIKGITEPVEFSVAAVGLDDNDLVTVIGNMEFDRSLFDVRYGSESFFEGLGDNVIKDVVEIQFVIVGK